MAGWDDVVDLVGGLPDAVAAAAHEGSPAYAAWRHLFARLRLDDDGAELLQTWTDDLGFADAAHARPEAFPVVHVFRYRVSTWARLARLDRRETAELLLESYAVRGGKRRGETVDAAAFFARV